jgi:hypothetical protein
MLSQVSHLLFNWLSDLSLSLHAMGDHRVFHDRLVLHSVGAVDNAVFIFSTYLRIKLVKITYFQVLLLVSRLKSLLGGCFTKLKVWFAKFSFGLLSLLGSLFIRTFVIKIKFLGWLAYKFVSVSYQNVRLTTLMWDWWSFQLKSLYLPVGIQVIKLILFTIINYRKA